MNVWMVVVLLGVAALAFGLWRFVRGLRPGRKINATSVVIGFCFPIVVMIMFSATLFDLFPGLTIVDTAALFAVGMVSGFFLGVYTMHSRIGGREGAER